MSVDLFLFSADGISQEALASSLSALGPDGESAGGMVHLWQLPTASVSHREAWDESGFSALERTVYSNDNIMLSAGPDAWGALVFIAATLAKHLRAKVFNPQEGTLLDVSSAPTLEAVRAWRDHTVAEQGLRLVVSHGAIQGSWQRLPPALRLKTVLTTISIATGVTFERTSEAQVWWRGQLPLPSGRQIQLSWSGVSRWSPNDTLTVSGSDDDAAQIDALADELGQRLEAGFERVVAYRR